MSKTFADIIDCFVPVTCGSRANLTRLCQVSGMSPATAWAAVNRVRNGRGIIHPRYMHNIATRGKRELRKAGITPMSILEMYSKAGKL